MLFVMCNEVKYNRFNFNSDFNSILQDYRTDYRIYQLRKYNISMFRLRRYTNGPITRYIV